MLVGWACNILGNKRRKAAAPCGDRGGFPFFNSIVYICILISNSSLHSSTTYLLLEGLPHSYDISQVHSLAYINSSFDIDSITRLTISCVASLTFPSPLAKLTWVDVGTRFDGEALNKLEHHPFWPRATKVAQCVEQLTKKKKKREL